MTITECKGRNVKISKGSITVKSEEGKTAGVVRNIISLYNIQPNKQMTFVADLKKKGISPMDVGLNNIIIKDNTLYFFRNVKNKKFHEKYGFFSDVEAMKEQQEDLLYTSIAKAGYEVIECILI